MELVTSSETSKQFDRVLTDVRYRNVCVVTCVTTAAAAAKTITIMHNSFYLLCTGHISHDPFLHRIQFNVYILYTACRTRKYEVSQRHTIMRTLYSLESEISF